MKGRRRFLLHLLLPPAFGAIFVLTIGWILEPKPWGHRDIVRFFSMLVVMIPYAYCFAIVPSLLYAALMELGYRRGLAPGRGWSVALSALLGLLAGAIPILGSAILESPTFSLKKAIELSPWPIAGLLTGLVIESIIGRMIRRGARAPNPSTTS